MKAVTKAWMAGIIVVLLCGLAAVLLVTRYSMRNRTAWRGRPGLASRWHPASGKEQGQDALATSEIVNPDWPMFRGGPNLSGRAPGDLPDELKVLWKFKTGGGIKSSPAVVDGLVFIGSSDKKIYAIDLQNGRQVWAYETTDAVEAAPCVIEGMVFVGSSDGFLYALDAKDGSLKWKYETAGQILGSANWTRSPDGRLWILVGSYDNKLHCVDSTNGRAVWVYETGNYINGSPAVDDGKTVFGGCDAVGKSMSATMITFFSGLTLPPGPSCGNMPKAIRRSFRRRRSAKAPLSLEGGTSGCIASAATTGRSSGRSRRWVRLTARR